MKDIKLYCTEEQYQDYLNGYWIYACQNEYRDYLLKENRDEHKDINVLLSINLKRNLMRSTEYPGYYRVKRISPKFSANRKESIKYLYHKDTCLILNEPVEINIERKFYDDDVFSRVKCEKLGIEVICRDYLYLEKTYEKIYNAWKLEFDYILEKIEKVEYKCLLCGKYTKQEKLCSKCISRIKNLAEKEGYKECTVR